MTTIDEMPGIAGDRPRLVGAATACAPRARRDQRTERDPDAMSTRPAVFLRHEAHRIFCAPAHRALLAASGASACAARSRRRSGRHRRPTRPCRARRRRSSSRSTDSFDYVRRDVMIPMRDGVKLHTVILVPKGANARADPADAHALQRQRAHDATRTARTSAPMLTGYDNAHRRRSSRAATSASCRTCAASTAPRATT